MPADELGTESRSASLHSRAEDLSPERNAWVRSVDQVEQLVALTGARCRAIGPRQARNARRYRTAVLQSRNGYGRGPMRRPRLLQSGETAIRIAWTGKASFGSRTAAPGALVVKLLTRSSAANTADKRSRPYAANRTPLRQPDRTSPPQRREPRRNAPGRRHQKSCRP